MALAPMVGLAGFLTYVVVFIFVRKSAPASVAGAWSLVLFAIIFAHNYILFAALLGLLGTWTHRQNLINHLDARRATN